MFAIEPWRDARNASVLLLSAFPGQVKKDSGRPTAPATSSITYNIIGVLRGMPFVYLKVKPEGTGKHSMRRCVLAAIATLIAVSALAQVGNEWINYSQPYFKIPVARSGIYRLTYSEVMSAGLSPAISPAQLKLFHRGQEQAIYVAGENDGRLDPGDYIEFYGIRNDGTLDTELYTDVSAQPHLFYNLFSDTTYYFLTVGPETGKRMPLIEETGGGVTPDPFFWQERKLIFTGEYASGRDYGNVLKTVYDTGEGWMSGQLTTVVSGSYVIENISNAVQTGPVPRLEIVVTGRNDTDHVVQLYAGTRLLTTLHFNGYTSLKHSQPLAWSDLEAGEKITINVKPVGTAGLPDRVSVGYLTITYPAVWGMDSEPEMTFITDIEPSTYSYIEISNAPAGTRLFDVTDPSTVSRLAALSTGTLSTRVSSSTGVILAMQTPLTSTVKPVSFSRIDANAHDFVIITQSSLRKPASGYTDPVAAYAEYRSLPAGGSFYPLVVNVDDLYDQFSFGEVTPLAIFHFMKYFAAGTLPEYLFIVGKGLDVYYGYNRNPGSFTHFRDLVPAAGYPASDMLFTAGLSGTEHAPAVATGRISASVPQDVAAYLNKVKELEALPFDDLRRKNILHLSGGIFEGEPQTFKAYLEEFATVAESLYLGGKVTPIAKQVTDLEVVNVADEVNNGVSLITFFGHSGPTTTDFDIGHVTDPALGYLNMSKYPLLLMNGCQIGSFFLNGSTFSENWVNAPDRGAIGVIAHSGLGVAFMLKNYSATFYETAFGDSTFIGRGLGDIQKEVANRFLSRYGSDPVDITQVQQMVLLGDPSVRLFGAGKPDYEINKNNLSITSFNGEPITVLTDSFRLNMIVRNFGRARDKPFTVRVERALEDNSHIQYDSVFSPVLYSDTLSFIIPGATNGAGNNTFLISVDSDDQIAELNETNNEASLEFFIPFSGTRNLFPEDYAIVNSNQLNLVFQHTNVLAGEQEFVLELDTIETFSSGFKKQFELTGNALLTQVVELGDTDTLAYYWRTKLVDPAGLDSIVWDESSFTYIKDGPDGWAQVHFPQRYGNALTNLVADRELRLMNFEETITDLSITTFGSLVEKPIDSVHVKINGAEYNIAQDFRCRNNTINLIAFDKKTAHPYPGLYFTWQDLLFNYGGKTLICGREPFVINSYGSDEVDMPNGGDLLDYVDNIPEGDSVVMFSIGDAGYDAWPLEVRSKLGDVGISLAQIEDLLPGEPVVILARKGSPPGSATINRAAQMPAESQAVQMKGTITGRTISGTMTSQPIGPALQWNGFFAKASINDAADNVLFDIIGLTRDGDEHIVASDIPGDSDISNISATQYPFIKVRYKPSDDVFVTAPQLRKWMVTFHGVPEGVALFRGPTLPDSLAEGEIWFGQYDFVNVSNRNFSDSLTVQYEITNAATFVSAEASMKIRGPAAQDTTEFIVPIATTGHPGRNSIRTFVNPYASPEQNFGNNVVVLNDIVFVTPDTEDPVLDVTFDGRHLANDDFTSPGPDIKITVWDNNPYLLKKDTADIVVLLAYPCESGDCPYSRVYFSRSDVTWKVETDSSEFTMEFKPEELAEGRYSLSVEARDVNGNPSGKEPFEITFQVTYGSNVVLNPPFPNPFYHTTKFSFILMGDVLPSSVYLQVLDLNGRAVYDTRVNDAGKIFFGTNTTGWDGVDNFGNSVPGGIYFYKFTVNRGAERSSATGRIVLAR